LFLLISKRKMQRYRQELQREFNSEIIFNIQFSMFNFQFLATSVK